MSVADDDPDLKKLFDAIGDGHEQDVASALAQRPDLVNARGREGETALHVAAYCNDVRIGALLVARGADPTATYGESGHTALSWAVTCHALDFADAMVQLGVDADLFCAAGMGSIERVASWFDDSGALRPNASRTGSTRLATDGSRLPCPPVSPTEQVSDALYIACRNAHAAVVGFLLTKSPDLAFKAYRGGTPLHWAHFSGSPEVVDLLMRAGADDTMRWV